MCGGGGGRQREEVKGLEMVQVRRQTKVEGSR